MQDHKVQEDLKRFEIEHRQLSTQISDVRKWIGEVCQLGVPSFGELGDRLTAVAETLDQHFRHEEQDGYLEEAVRELPRFQSEADELLAEHAELHRRLGVLIQELQHHEQSTESWQHACHRLEEFLRDLARHEAREMAILAAANESRGESASEA